MRKYFPISTVAETLAKDVKNDTEVKNIHIPKHGNIYYEVGGEGDTVILIHCWAGARQYWKHTISALLWYYRVYALDLKGFGESDKPKDGYKMADFVDLLDNFFEKVGISKAILVGHSMGGSIAMSYTMAHPDKVKKIVLVALPISTYPVGHKLIGAPLIGGIWYRCVRFIGKRSLKSLAAREIWSKPTVASATKSMRTFVKTNPLKRIHEINCPLLLILGKNDPAAPRASVVKNANTTRFAIKLAVIADARHSPQCENPEEFNRKLLAFLRDNYSALIAPAKLQIK